MLCCFCIDRGIERKYHSMCGLHRGKSIELYTTVVVPALLYSNEEEERQSHPPLKDGVRR